MGRTIHGASRRGPDHSLFRLWSGIIERCFSTKCKDYPRYGGRGIFVCESWMSFENFKKDVSPRPTGMTMDRIDNDGPYSKDNFRWATRKEQARNRKGNKRITIDGETKTISEWVDHFGTVKYSCAVQRIREGKDPFLSVTKPGRLYR